MAGAPKKPLAIKIMQGTDRPDRDSKEIMPSKITHIPSPPKILSRAAKKEWKSVCQELINLDMLHGVDLFLLAAYCIESSRYLEAIQEMEDIGPVNAIYREDGSVYYQQSPWVSIANSALKNSQSLAKEFGFTPANRLKSAADTKDSTDPLMVLLEQKRKKIQ